MRPINEGVPKVVMLITDGESNDRQLTLMEADKIKKREFNIISIGVGNVNLDELLAVSSTENDFYYVENYNKILEIINSISRTTCLQPAEIETETSIKTRVEIDSYKYFKYQLNETLSSRSFTIELKQLTGDTKLFYSFETNNPKEDADNIKIPFDPSVKEENFYEDPVPIRRQRRNSNLNKINDFYEINKKSSSNSKYYQIDPKNKTIIYLSVKGYKNDNLFEVFIHNKVINTQSDKKNPPYSLIFYPILGAIIVVLSISLIVITFKYKKIMTNVNVIEEDESSIESEYKMNNL
jgi:hypothetical protein